jgi:hypothetical protein
MTSVPLRLPLVQTPLGTSSKVPARAEAPGSEGMIDSPDHTVRRKKNKGRSR